MSAHRGHLASYRFYFMTADDHIARGQYVECNDDADAIARARELHHIDGVEIWHERRKVARIEPALERRIAGTTGAALRVEPNLRQFIGYV